MGGWRTCEPVQGCRQMLRLGYPCQHLGLPATTNRSIRLVSLSDLEKVRTKIEHNLDDLEHILRWNAAHNVGLFRIGQQLIPFASHPDFPYDWQQQHGPRLAELGLLANQLGQRLSLHPGQFINPGSPDDNVVERSLAELHYTAQLLDLLQCDDGVIVLHMGGAYGDPPSALHRFVEVLRNQQAICRYLAIEVDERVWTVEKVVEAATALGVGAIVDTLHHRINPGKLSLREAIDLSRPTWKHQPKMHISSQDQDKKAGAHARLIDPADWHTLLGALDGRATDIMVEAKGKEEAVIGLIADAPEVSEPIERT
jgi:UV DNA damage endonuclease